jgi:hypothetical protein
MDPTKKPPEMSMYLSTLKKARIHREDGGSWRLLEPATQTPSQDPCRVLPAFQEIRRFLERRGDARVRISELFDHLQLPPLGIRNGLAPLFLALYTAMHLDDLAFYEDGTFLRAVRGDEFMRMSKAPETFEIQFCRIEGLRADVFDLLVRILEIASANKPGQLLDIVRPLCQFVAQLPNYARNTNRLSPTAVSVRSAILTAQEPVKLLFEDLPIGCGMAPFPVNGPCPSSAAKQFAERLRAAIDELRTAFSALLSRMRDYVRTEFDVVGPFAVVRERLSVRAEPLVVMAIEPRMRALCMRLTDAVLAEDAWLESFGSLLSSQPPSRWHDNDEDTFKRELSSHALRFRNLESIAFKARGKSEWAEAFRVALTKEDGSEVQEVIYVSKEDSEAVDQLAAALRAVLGADRRLGMAAISKVAWKYIGGR